MASVQASGTKRRERRASKFCISLCAFECRARDLGIVFPPFGFRQALHLKEKKQKKKASLSQTPSGRDNTSLTGQFLWQVSRSREWAHPVGKVVFNSMEDGGCCCGVVGWTNAKAGAAAAARKQVVEAAEAPILACG